jgi:MFS family permease
MSNEETTSRRLPWTYGIVLGLGFFGITVLGPIFNTYLPLILHAQGFSPTAVGFVMTWDDWLRAFIPPWAGARSDRTWTRLGRRRPWVLAGAPIGALSYVLIPHLAAGFLLLPLVFLHHVAMALVRAPGLALLGDLFAPAERSKASGVINLVGGLGALAALVGSSRVYALGPQWPFWLGGLLVAAGVFVFLLAVPERREWGPAATDGGAYAAVWWRWLRPGRMAAPLSHGAVLLLAATFCLFSAFSIVETWISSYAALALGVEPGRLPLILAVFAAALIVGAVPAGFLGTRMGPQTALVAGMTTLAAAFGLNLVVQTPALLMASLVPAGLAWALIIINLFPLLYEVGGEDRAGLLTGLYYAVTSLAGILGPQLLGVVLELMGRNYQLMWAPATVAVLVGLEFLRRVEGKGKR